MHVRVVRAVAHVAPLHLQVPVQKVGELGVMAGANAAKSEADRDEASKKRRRARRHGRLRVGVGSGLQQQRSGRPGAGALQAPARVQTARKAVALDAGRRDFVQSVGAE